ncbi:MAG: hypothetical protein ACYCVN_03200 [Acidimicrobiales bacterium]
MSIEPWAILCHHRQDPEVPQHPVTPGLLKTDWKDHRPTFAQFSIFISGFCPHPNMGPVE